MTRTWTIGRVGLALLPVALLGLGIAAPAADAGLPPLYFTNTGGGEIGAAVGLSVSATDQLSDQSAISGSGGYTTGLAVYGQQLYWANEQTSSGSGSIGVASLDASGNPIASSVNPDLIPPSIIYGRPQGIAVNGRHIYWTDNRSGTIDMTNRDGSDPTVLINGLQDPLGLAVNAQHIYWTSGGTTANGTGAIGEASLDGSDPNPGLVTGLDLPVSIALSGTDIYWVASNDDHIAAADLDGGAVNKDFLSLNEPAAVALLDGSIFWTDVKYRTIGAEDLDGTGYTSELINGLADPEALTFATPEATVAPGSLTAAAAPGTTYGPIAVTITNAGLADLDVDGTSIGGADSGDFSIAWSTCFTSVPLGLNGTCEVGINFTPQESQGESSATLEIDSNDLVDGPLYVPLTGTVQVGGSTTPITPISATPTSTTPPVIPPPGS